MKFTIEYIPLSKIKPDLSLKMTKHLKKLQRLMWDCMMYVMVVKKNRKDGSYIIVSGQDRFENLKKHTKNMYAPCIVDKSDYIGRQLWFHRLWKKQPLDDFPFMPTSWLIVRSFLKQEPRFQNLSRSEQIRVLRIAACYKKTVIYTMKKRVDDILRSNE
ncbi:hypothetical protein [Niallia endozanthoxylica]|uniref:ParB/Sulfiredoxin domain-containing protein n=1 Tax=Niallia endozanthoxylica TaxID=2036016 RepID=A0A5J5I0L6_9BACI|nr:hypothetical protein [Niallia endozanthoxylica]KAA9029110.1 hypothetical protein F4V44_03335 [Niallia endozanthoxylica]